VDQVPDPPFNDVIVIEAALPELPVARIKKGSDAPPPVPQKPPEPPHQDTPVQPNTTPETVPTPAPAPASSTTPVPPGPGDRDGSENGSPDGTKDGVDGLPFSGTGKGSVEVSPPHTDEPIHLTAAMTRPVFLDGPQPRYTEMARRAGTQGAVIVEAIVDE